MLAPNPMLMEGFTPPSARRKTTGPLPIASPDDGIVWYLALDGKRTGPFSKQQLVDKLAPLSKNADVHIWNEKLGDWKPPSQVPAIASEIAARKKAPPPPPMPVGAPRRPTPPPPPTLASLGAAQAHAHAHAAAPAPASAPRRPTPHPPVGAPSLVPATASGAHPAHAKLPLPSGAGIQRPGLFSAAVPASAAPAESGDPLSLLETPAPQLHMLQPGHTTNGTGNGRASRATSSDVLQMLNMPGTPQTSPGAAPRLMSVAPATTWTPSAESSGRRNKSAQLILVLLGVVAVIIVVAVMGTMRSKKAVAPTAPETTAAIPPPPPPPPEKVEPVVAPPPPVEQPTAPGTKGKLGKSGKSKPGVQSVRAGVTPPAGTVSPPPPPAEAADNTGGAAARFRDGRTMGINAGVSSRPPPSQADITKVISNNRGNIKTCYQRALLRDNSLTHGKIAVKLSIGISGRVKHVGLDGPAQFKSLEPCIKEVVQRWVFPQASEEYGTEFPLVFQGNE